MSELKPCPFCGSPAYSYHDNCIDFAGVKCDLGGCVCADILITENNWNTRPIEDALNARIAKLVNLVEVQHDDNCHLADMCRERDARIAELEALVGELIEAGDAIINAYPTWAKENAWNALVEEWKAREK